MAAANAGISVAEATFLSLVIYSGASQFVALALLSSGTPLLLGALTLLAMNARHVFYGPALLGRLGRRATIRYAPLWAYGLTDEVFAAALATPFAGGAEEAGDGQRPAAWSEAWMSGITLAAYLAWASGTYVGASLGGAAFAGYPAVEAALGFMLPALFVALLLALLSRRQLATAIVAAAACLLATPLTSAATGILVGMLAGALVAVASPVWGGRRRGSQP